MMAVPKLYTSTAWLRAEYVVKHRSIEELAKQCNVATNTIRAQLKKNGFIK